MFNLVKKNRLIIGLLSTVSAPIVYWYARFYKLIPPVYRTELREFCDIGFAYSCEYAKRIDPVGAALTLCFVAVFAGGIALIVSYVYDRNQTVTHK